MMQKRFITPLLILFTLVALILFIVVNVDSAESGREHEEDLDEHSIENSVEIAPEIASRAGIRGEIARSGQINQSLVVYGKTVVDPSKVSHIRARFPGTITKIRSNIGDRVKAGDILAEIESNESLKHYTIKSPLSGVITARNGNPGELAQEQVLLTVANYEQIWVEFQIFPSQAQKISVGQAITAYSDLHQSESVIKHLLSTDTEKPFLLARAPLDNANGQWKPGLLLEGKIVIKQTPVSLLVDNRALQTMQGQQVVFVQSKNSYERRPLKLGLSDDKFTEVIDGLHPGEQYVVENSYLIKADLEKSAAADDD